LIDKPLMLITGTSKGIGRYLAEFYSSEGYLVIGCSRSDMDYKSIEYQHYTLDISDENLVKSMFTEVRRKYGRLDVLINNAGIAAMNHVLLTPLKEMQKVLNSNVIGTFLCCREAAKLMKRNRYGRIVNISSIHVPLATEGTSIYSASKASIEQFSRVLSRELVQFGITTNSLALSIVTNSGMASHLSDDMTQKILDRTVSKVQLNYSDITNSINFLISPESGMVVNQTINLGGI
jgi:3-oxoacyl-[acyl-carrier protein] reductase